MALYLCSRRQTCAVITGSCNGYEEGYRKEELLQEIDRLKQELRLKSIDLKRTEMARDAYERMIVLAEERYGIPIRKKSDAK